MDEYHSSQPYISQHTTNLIPSLNYNGIDLQAEKLTPNFIHKEFSTNGTTIIGSLGTNATSPLDFTIDFTRPDSQRTRPLLIDGKRLYVDEHYISVWSPILKSWCIECPDRELILADVQYDHVLELFMVIKVLFYIKINLLINIGNSSNIQIN